MAWNSVNYDKLISIMTEEHSLLPVFLISMLFRIRLENDDISHVVVVIKQCSNGGLRHRHA